MAIRLTNDQALHLRLRGQRLLPRQPDGPAAIVPAVRRVCGLQAQDMFAATLGIRVRSPGATLAGVEQTRFVERSLVWTWAMRGTLHLLTADDLDWLLPLVGPVLVLAGQRRRQQLGLDDETYARGLRALSDHLAAHGPATRDELVGALAAAGLPGGYRFERHLFYRAALEGIICFGPDRGAKPTYALLEDWLGRPLRPAQPEAALAELASRYLAAYRPAAPADLASWSGLPATLVRAAWNSVADRLTEVSIAGESAWLPSERLAELDEPLGPPSIRLLPAFDTYLLGYRSRDLIVAPDYAGRINAGGGMIHAVVLIGGRVAGTWHSNRKGRRVNITVDPFAELAPDEWAAITAETADIERFLGSTA